MNEIKKFTIEEKVDAWEKFDEIYKTLFNQTNIRFIGSKIYEPFHGWSDMDNDLASQLFTVLKKDGTGRKEYIVEGNELILNTLKSLPSNNAWGLSFEEATNFLDYNKIKWEIIFDEEAEII